MHTTIIFIYCLADELLKSLNHRDHEQIKMTDAEVMTFALTAALFFGGNYAKTSLFFKSHHYFTHLLGKSRLNKSVLRINEGTWMSILAVCYSILKKSKDREYIVDSFPVPICSNARITRCKLLREKKYHGYCSAKQSYFFGIKVHVLTTASGVPLEVIFTPGSTSDITAFRLLNLDIEKGSVIYGDKGYTDYQYEDLLADVGITLCSHRKKNSKRQHSHQVSAIQKYRRKRIETTFSGIIGLMPRHIHAVTFNGFVLKILLFVVVFSVNQV